MLTCVRKGSTEIEVVNIIVILEVDSWESVQRRSFPM